MKTNCCNQLIIKSSFLFSACFRVNCGIKQPKCSRIKPLLFIRIAQLMSQCRNLIAIASLMLNFPFKKIFRGPLYSLFSIQVCLLEMRTKNNNHHTSTMTSLEFDGLIFSKTRVFMLCTDYRCCLLRECSGFHFRSIQI